MRSNKPLKAPLSNAAEEKKLCDFFRKDGFHTEELGNVLIKQFQKGSELFRHINQERIKLAFEAFTDPMREALYEILYLLHVNEPFLKEVRFKAVKAVVHGRPHFEDRVAELYVPGAPAGLKGIHALSETFRSEFEAYIRKTFGRRVKPAPPAEETIQAVYSIGSIGTVAHKSFSSDLDLEVQYDLTPFFYSSEQWDDALLKKAFLDEYKRLKDRFFEKKGLAPPAKPANHEEERIFRHCYNQMAKKYPLLYVQLIVQKKDLTRALKLRPSDKIRIGLMDEIITLMKGYEAARNQKEQSERQTLLLERIKRIQAYVQAKFWDVEVYLFPFSSPDLLAGSFGSTLDNKESSGGAYELILNYETLFPGIFFNPVIPVHYLLSQELNNNEKEYESFIDYARFGLLNFGHSINDAVIDQGPCPDLPVRYVADHYGAVYWEAFKATGGNLPKAFLNLLRFEILLEEDLLKTIIQLIKEPDYLEYFIPAPQLEDADSLRIQQILELESLYPLLHTDPWWLKFKSLKIAFGNPNLLPEIDDAERASINSMLDYAFALHVRLSDVFAKPGAKGFTQHRQKVLASFLELAFMEGGYRHNRLLAIFFGDPDILAELEKEMKELFLGAIQRIRKKVDFFQSERDIKTDQEYQIWFSHYMSHFVPEANQVPRSILTHLQSADARLKIGYRQGQGWFFVLVRKKSSLGGRFDQSFLSLLPEEITLMQGKDFLFGLVYCMINGYYGILNEGTLRETRTLLEYDSQAITLERKVDSTLAFVRPDQIERIMLSVKRHFPPLKVSYLDCVKNTRRILEVMVFLNLLRYGRLYFLYRDDLDNYWVDSMEIEGFEKFATVFSSAPQMMFEHEPLLIKVVSFFKRKGIQLDQTRMRCWVNCGSFDASELATRRSVKEMIKEEEKYADFFQAAILNYENQRKGTLSRVVERA